MVSGRVGQTLTRDGKGKFLTCYVETDSHSQEGELDSWSPDFSSDATKTQGNGPDGIPTALLTHRSRTLRFGKEVSAEEGHVEGK